MRSETITLGGNQYVVTELPTKKNSAFRADVNQAFEPLAKALEAGPKLFARFDGADTVIDAPLANTVAQLVQGAGGVLLNSPDKLRELVYDYSDAIAIDAEQLEEVAYDSEYLTAFTKILGLAYPFGSVATLLTQLNKNGRASEATSQS